MNKAAFYKLSYGLYVITSGEGEKSNGQIANTVFQVTSDPPTVVVSINKANYTHELIRSSRKFAVSILEEATPMKMIGQFGFKCGRDIDKFSGIQARTGETGIPVVTSHAVAFIETEVTGEMDCGTHTLFLGKVVDCDILDAAAEPMTYAYYRKIKGGKSPKSAPTHQEEAPPPSSPPAEKAMRYTCKICGYIYDPQKGDPEGKINPGTRFEDLPADWVCPVCGAAKDQFEKEK
ncbi:MAG: High molecular weight rubredoxin [Deltaproteobacteria bacterium]|nr:High molecular weight rubredoxin [Deltaproteobacteria bacterium]